MCKAKGHLANRFKKSSRGAATGAAGGGGGFGKPLVLAIKPKLLSFAMGTKNDSAKEGARGIVIDEV